MSGTPVPDELWLVYLPEWLIAYTSRAAAQPGWEECLAWFQRHYGNRIYPDDWRIKPSGSEQDPTLHKGRWMLQLRLNNLRGEFVGKSLADELASELGTGAEVVVKFSRDARKLAEYGQRTIHAKT